MVTDFVYVQGIWVGMLVGTVLQTIILFVILFRTKWQKEVSSTLDKLVPTIEKSNSWLHLGSCISDIYAVLLDGGEWCCRLCWQKSGCGTGEETSTCRPSKKQDETGTGKADCAHTTQI